MSRANRCRYAGRTALSAGFALALLLAPAALADETAPLPELRFDPFAARATLSNNSAAQGPFVPVLRGTLVSRADSIANLGGRILRVGEESHGYRLLSVTEGEAEFETESGGRLVLEVVAPEQEDH